jgi:hydroxymethylpyrimidine/phosphomethylpyrimidine kinase
VYGTSVITAITAQNTVGVTVIHAVPGEIVLAQARAVLADIRIDAVKVGMLGTVETTLAVARVLDELPPGIPVVVDPVMVAESGASLLDSDAQQALIREILPRATVLTPNLPEARVLSGELPNDRQSVAMDEEEEAEVLLRAVLALGPRVVVLTGGHRARAVDIFLDASGDGSVVGIEGERHSDGAAHGSGCTHSSVLAAQLALGCSPLHAARTARALAGEAVADGLRDIGEGTGPVDVLGLARMRAAH